MTAIDRARETAEERMTDVCEIVRPSDAAPTLDRTTGELVTPAGTTVYTGPCSVQSGRGRNVNEQTEGGADVAVVDYLVRVPHDTIGPRRGDIVTFSTTDNPDLLDAELVILRNDMRTRRASIMLPCVDRHYADPLPEPI